MLKLLILQLIRLYQRLLSPDTGLLHAITGPVCRFKPTCSEYTYQAIERYGIMQGTLLGLRRILRCNPWSKVVLDPVP